MENEKKLKKVLKAMVVVASVGLGACAPAKVQWKTMAGVGQDQMGVIIENVQESDLQKLKSTKPVSFRKLYNNTVEVMGMTKNEIDSLLPDKKTVQNLYFYDLIPSSNPEFDIQDAVDTKSCRKDLRGPEFEVDVDTSNEALLSKSTVVQVGKDFVTLSVRDGADPSIRFQWYTSGPAGSQYEQKTVFGKKISVSPEKPGAYRVMVVGQDKSGGCSVQMMIFGATINEPFFNPGEPHRFGDEDREMFKHLQVISAENAWKKTRGKGVVVAIIDSGVNYNHPDLAANLLTNSREVAGNGVDDDGNGLVDDFLGYDFIMGDEFPFDDNSHGSHVAGLAAGAVGGVANKASILAVKVGNALGGGDAASINAGIRYAVDRGASIINISMGSDHPGFKDSLKDSVAYAEARGVLIVAAAGNGDKSGKGLNNDTHVNFPSNFTNANVLAVAATDLTGTLSSYSNYGANTVHVAAPGGSSVDGPLAGPSYDPGISMYVGMSGTSMATPVVAGIAALVKSAYPELSGPAIKKRIMSTALRLPALTGKVNTGALANAAKAVGL